MSVPLPVVRAGRERFEVHLGPQERRILESIMRELLEALDDPAGRAPDGALARLYPAAFPDDPSASADFAALVHADLTATRRERMAVVESTVDAESLDETQATAWLGALNDARLVLGTSLGVTDDDPGDPAGEDDPEAMRHAVYAYLGWLVGAFTDALAEGLPAVPDEA